MRIGVLGLGRMGLPIAVALGGAGHEVVGFDPDASRVALARGVSVPMAETAAALARSADVLVTVLPGPGEVSAALLGGELFESLARGGLWLDLTSNDPDVLEDVAALALSHGVDSVSAPMAGGPASAASGTLRFFVSGEDAAVARARPLLLSLAGDATDAGAIDHAGTRIGDGTIAKLLANLLWFGQVVAVSEALLLGVSLGIPVAALRTSLAASAGGSVFIDEYLDSLLAGDYLESFGIDRVVEELDNLVRLASRAGVPFELSSTVARLHREALDRFGAVDGELLAARLLEERAGIRLRAGDRDGRSS